MFFSTDTDEKVYLRNYNLIILHLTIRSINRRDRLASDKFIFLFGVCFLQKTIIDMVHYRLIHLKYLWWIFVLDNFSLLADLLGRGLWYIASYFIIINQPNVHFLTRCVLQQDSLWINQFFLLNLFSFPFSQDF